MLTTGTILRKKFSVKDQFGNCRQKLQGNYKGLVC